MIQTPGSHLFYENRREDRFAEAKAVHRSFIWFMVLYLGFGLADWVLYPDKFALFLSLRLAYCLIPIGTFFLIHRAKNFVQTEILATFHAAAASGLITFMIYATEGVFSNYSAGLNLIAMIALCFFTFSKRYFWISVALIYVPYFACAPLFGHFPKDLPQLILNTMYILGTILVTAFIHHHKEEHRNTDIEARIRLKNEIDNRDEIIHVKTQEAVRLNALSAQFSPQVVEAIRNGKVKLDAGARTEICAIFIDIVGSTERVSRIDKDKVNRAISRFLDTSVKILLKYDITIDKFLGDGILGFCNAPLKREDYVNRVVSAALEVRETIKADQDFFEKNWMNTLEIRIGIARGFATVSFFGSQNYYRCYTAIGPVMNLASRLCASAEPNQILVENDVFEVIESLFEIKFLGKKRLKGFEDDIIRAYEVVSSQQDRLKSVGVNDCPTCGHLLSLETNALGQFEFVCKSCLSKPASQVALGEAS